MTHGANPVQLSQLRPIPADELTASTARSLKTRLALAEQEKEQAMLTVAALEKKVDFLTKRNSDLYAKVKELMFKDTPLGGSAASLAFKGKVKTTVLKG